MKKLFMAFAAALLLAFQAHAADGDAKTKKEPTPAQQAQREKMKTCNQEARSRELKGDERKAFMSSCLSGEGRAAKSDKVAGREKAEQCKQEAKEQKLTGDARKAYLSTCLEA
ncbi:MAG: PsiF family protein [Betaproteobacteria bacterium]|nr:PsiF family protein [Betaproteobacteria bacterium]